MATVVGLTLIKKFSYRGDPNEEYSNDYHFTGAVPADAAAWLALSDALIAQEKTIYHSDVKVVAAYGYDSDDDHAHAVWSHDYGTGVAGTLAVTGQPTPGDAAVQVRWKTSRNNSKGKPIYLRKYFHRAEGQGTGNEDLVSVGQLGAMSAFGTKMFDGSFIDGRTIRSKKHAETIVSRLAGPFITTRTLKRRGKRPS